MVEAQRAETAEQVRSAQNAGSALTRLSGGRARNAFIPRCPGAGVDESSLPLNDQISMEEFLVSEEKLSETSANIFQLMKKLVNFIRIGVKDCQSAKIEAYSKRANSEISNAPTPWRGGTGTNLWNRQPSSGRRASKRLWVVLSATASSDHGFG